MDNNRSRSLASDSLTSTLHNEPHIVCLISANPTSFPSGILSINWGIIFQVNVWKSWVYHNVIPKLYCVLSIFTEHHTRAPRLTPPHAIPSWKRRVFHVSTQQWRPALAARPGIDGTSGSCGSSKTFSTGSGNG